jgi:hypothetical protein
MIWAGHGAWMRKMRNSFTILAGNSEVERPLGRPRYEQQDNIKVDLK